MPPFTGDWDAGVVAKGIGETAAVVSSVDGSGRRAAESPLNRRGFGDRVIFVFCEAGPNFPLRTSNPRVAAKAMTEMASRYRRTFEVEFTGGN